MDRSQASLVALLARHGCRACTDVTGFGLLGHLGEMIGEDVVVRLDAEAVPALPGALELLEQGHASTLAPANAMALGLLGGPVRLADAAGAATAARQALWIDPQTCGPLLAALPAERTPAALAELHRAGFGDAALIAQVETAAA
jgi:selenide,water dikinase